MSSVLVSLSSRRPFTPPLLLIRCSCCGAASNAQCVQPRLSSLAFFQCSFCGLFFTIAFIVNLFPSGTGASSWLVSEHCLTGGWRGTSPAEGASTLCVSLRPPHTPSASGRMSPCRSLELTGAFSFGCKHYAACGAALFQLCFSVIPVPFAFVHISLSLLSGSVLLHMFFLGPVHTCKASWREKSFVCSGKEPTLALFVNGVSVSEAVVSLKHFTAKLSKNAFTVGAAQTPVRS